MMKNIILLVIVLSFVFTFYSAVAFAQIDVSCRGEGVPYPWCGEVTNLGQLVRNFYTVALGLAGGAAFGVIVYGAVMRMTAAGSPSGINEANEWITGALLGVVLLFGAYLILNTINPQLVSLRDIMINREGIAGGDWQVDITRCPRERPNAYKIRGGMTGVLGHHTPRCEPCDKDPNREECPDQFCSSLSLSTCFDQYVAGGLIPTNWSKEFELVVGER